MTTQIIRERIYLARREKKLSQEELTRKINEAGHKVSLRTIVRVEKDGRTNLFLLEKIAAIVGKPLEYFMTNDADLARQKHLEKQIPDGTTYEARCPNCNQKIQIEINKNNEASITGTVKSIAKAKRKMKP